MALCGELPQRVIFCPSALSQGLFWELDSSPLCGELLVLHRARVRGKMWPVALEAPSVSLPAGRPHLLTVCVFSRLSRVPPSQNPLHLLTQFSLAPLF